MSERPDGNGIAPVEDRPRTGDSPEAFARSDPPGPPPPRRPFYKRPLVLVIILLVLITGITIALIWWLNARHYQTTDDAFIQADYTRVSPRVAGHVMAVKFEENRTVAAGDVLVELDPADLDAKVNESAAAVEAAVANKKQAEETVAAAEADLGQSKAAEQAAQTEAQRATEELQRYLGLSAQAVTQQQLNNLRATARSSEAQLQAAKQKTVASEAHIRFAKSQITAAEAQIAQAKATLQASQLQRSYATISAAIPGTVTNRSVQVGDYVQVGQALAALVPTQVYAIANYKETQLDLIQPGQEVDVTVDAYPGHMFHGKVDSIQRGSGAAFSLLPPENATGNYVKVVQRVPVKIVFDPQGFRMGPGMSVVPKVKVR